MKETGKTKRDKILIYLNKENKKKSETLSYAGTTMIMNYMDNI